MAGFFIGSYALIAFVSALYFWWSKTDKSRAPFERRMIALGHGFIWPYYLVLFIQAQIGKAEKDKARQDRHQRILGDATSPQQQPGYPPVQQPGQAPADGQRRVANPFDN